MQDKVKVTVAGRSEPQLRKLARALISLAHRQLATEAIEAEDQSSTGDAA